MTHAKPTSEEFEVKANVVTHKPTGAQWWWKYPDSESGDVGHRISRLGSVLPIGENYNAGEVSIMTAFKIGSNS
jgi:hypothetical protein